MHFSLLYLAAFPQFIPTGDGVIAAAFVLAILHSLIAAIWFGAMGIRIARLINLAQDGSFQRWLKGGTGAVFIGFVFKLATYRFWQAELLFT